jgi:hypothetical protein
MTLDNLTSEQVSMCDLIWNIKDKYEFRKVSSAWSSSKMNMALTLIQLMLQEELEPEIQEMDSYPLAEEMIKSCM